MTARTTVTFIDGRKYVQTVKLKAVK